MISDGEVDARQNVNKKQNKSFSVWFFLLLVFLLLNDYQKCY